MAAPSSHQAGKSGAPRPHPLWPQLQPFRDRIPTSCLVQAPPGEDLFGLMVSWASSLLCERPEPATGLACGGCPSCGWMAARQHPDVRWVMPEALWASSGGPEADAADDASRADAPDPSEGSGESDKAGSWEIKIGQVRALEEFANLSAHRGGTRIVVLGPVECLNTPAANALLKSLEEPPPGLQFLLWSERSQGIPATVLSRCRRARLHRPAPLGQANPQGRGPNGERVPVALLGQTCLESPEPWLLPLMTAGQVNPSGWADKAGKSPPEGVLNWLMLWLVDVQAALHGAEPMWFSSELRNTPQPRDASQVADASRRLAEGIARLQDYLRHANHPLNPKLFYEQIFETFRHATADIRR